MKGERRRNSDGDQGIVWRRKEEEGLGDTERKEKMMIQYFRCGRRRRGDNLGDHIRV